MGSIGGGLRNVHSFNVGLQTTAFQAEIYAIKACMMENLEYSHRQKKRHPFQVPGSHHGTSQFAGTF
jgi:hypothetical protein